MPFDRNKLLLPGVQTIVCDTKHLAQPLFLTFAGLPQRNLISLPQLQSPSQAPFSSLAGVRALNFSLGSRRFASTFFLPDIFFC